MKFYILLKSYIKLFSYLDYCLAHYENFTFRILDLLDSLSFHRARIPGVISGVSLRVVRTTACLSPLSVCALLRVLACVVASIVIR